MTPLQAVFFVLSILTLLMLFNLWGVQIASTKKKKKKKKKNRSKNGLRKQNASGSLFYTKPRIHIEKGVLLAITVILLLPIASFLVSTASNVRDLANESAGEIFGEKIDRR